MVDERSEKIKPSGPTTYLSVTTMISCFLRMPDLFFFSFFEAIGIMLAHLRPHYTQAGQQPSSTSVCFFTCFPASFTSYLTSAKKINR